MNRINRVTAMAFAAALSILFVGEASAKKFDETTIRGTWTLFVQGFVTPGGFFDTMDIFPGQTPLVAIATVTFDGSGDCASSDQLVIGGVRIPANPEDFRVADECFYVVNDDGTGFFKVTFPAFEGVPASTTTASFVIRDKKKMRFIADNNEIGVYGGGEMERQQRGSNDIDDDD